MNEIINLYDNFLIYYPNIFFPLLFLLNILGLFLLVKGIIFIKKKFIKTTKEIIFYFSRIKIKKKARIELPSANFAKNGIYILNNALSFYIKINKLFRYSISQIEKIIAKIKKEVLID